MPAGRQDCSSSDPKIVSQNDVEKHPDTSVSEEQKKTLGSAQKHLNSFPRLLLASSTSVLQRVSVTSGDSDVQEIRHGFPLHIAFLRGSELNARSSGGAHCEIHQIDEDHAHACKGGINFWQSMQVSGQTD